MIKLLAYPVRTLEADVEWRCFRMNNRGRIVALNETLCVALAAKRGGMVRPAPGQALVANAAGLRAIRRYYVEGVGDYPAIYGADGAPYKTVCAAIRTFFGYVPDGGGCA